MPSYTPTQKSAIQQFTGFTHTKESVAAKQLKNHNWNIEQAIDASLIHPTTGKHMADEYPIDGRYFQSNNTSKDASSSTSTLTKLFDTYRDNPKDEPDTIGVEGSMRYLQDLGLSLEEPVVLAILTELAAPTMGELTRSGFIDGWKRLR
ncbi:MAG: hypothetical protein Q9192_000298, partial [Flavoplaca navasiana]